MRKKIGKGRDEVQQKIEQALRLIQDSSTSEVDLEQIKSSLEQLGKEAYAFIKKKLSKTAPEELNPWLELVSFLGDKSFAAQLKQLFYRKDINLPLKEKIAYLLEQLGCGLPAQINEALRASQFLYQKLCSAIKGRQSKRLERKALEEFLKIPDFLQISLLYQLIDETGDESFPLMAKLFGLNKVLDEFLISRLGEISSISSAQTLNLWLDRSKDKAQKKFIKKSLYKLTLKGIDIEPPPKKIKAEPLKLDISAEDMAYASHIDGMGDRLLFLARNNPPYGLMVFKVVLSTNRGIYEIEKGEMKRRELRKFIRNLEDERKFMLIQIEPDYCQFLIEEAAQINQARKVSLPEEYEKWKEWLQRPAKTYPEPLIYRVLPRPSLQDKRDLVEKSAELLKIAPFDMWILAPEEIENPAQQLRESVDSRLVLTPLQQKDRIESIFRKVADEYFTPQRRRLYRRHLEEMAYILIIKGKKKSARMALAIALAMEEQAPTLIPFVRDLVKRSLFWRAGIKPKEEPKPESRTDSGIIIPEREPKSQEKEGSRIIIPSEEIREK